MVLFVAELHSFVCLLNYMSIAFDKYLLWILRIMRKCYVPDLRSLMVCSARSSDQNLWELKMKKRSN